MDKYAIIVAGGSGIRMGTSLPKQFLLLRSKPVLWYSITAFLDAYTDISLIVVLPELYMAKGKDLVGSIDRGKIVLATGGKSRYESVQNGLKLVPKNSIVFVHDGVRCLLTPQLIKRCYDTTIVYGNATPAISAVDTIRIEHSSGNELIDRAKVRIIQTPQTFFSDTLKQAFAQESHESFTDDASVVEKLGEKIHLVEGEITNIKITSPIDLMIAEKILEEREAKK